MTILKYFEFCAALHVDSTEQQSCVHAPVNTGMVQVNLGCAGPHLNPLERLLSSGGYSAHPYNQFCPILASGQNCDGRLLPELVGTPAPLF